MKNIFFVIMFFLTQFAYGDFSFKVVACKQIDGAKPDHRGRLSKITVANNIPDFIGCELNFLNSDLSFETEKYGHRSQFSGDYAPRCFVTENREAFMTFRHSINGEGVYIDKSIRKLSGNIFVFNESEISWGSTYGHKDFKSECDLELIVD